MDETSLIGNAPKTIPENAVQEPRSAEVKLSALKTNTSVPQNDTESVLIKTRKRQRESFEDNNNNSRSQKAEEQQIRHHADFYNKEIQRISREERVRLGFGKNTAKP